MATFAAPAPASSPRVTILLCSATWALCSLALLLWREGFPFPPYGQYDTWFYTGYGWDLPGQLKDFGNTYYGSRLSWLLPLSLLHGALPLLTAEVVFKLGFSGLLTTALALIGWQIGRQRGAWTAAWLAPLCPEVIMALHGDYADTAVLTYGMWTTAAILRAGENARHWRWLLLAGMSFGLMAVANLGAVGNIGLGLAVLHLCWLRRTWWRHISLLGLYLLGAGIVVGLGQVAHQALGGNGFFLQAQIDMVLRFQRTGTSNPWYRPGWDWLAQATWLVLPLGVTAWGVMAAWCDRTRTDVTSRLRAALTYSLGFTLALGVVHQLRGAMVLSLNYYANSLLCLALPLALALISRGDPRTGRPPSHSVLGGIGLLTLFIVLGPAHGPGLASKLGLDLADYGHVLWGGLFGLGGLLALLWYRTRRWKPFPSGTLAAAYLLLLLWGSISWHFQHPFYSNRLAERYAVVHEAHSWLESHLSRGEYYFWVDQSFADGVSLACTKLWQYRRFDRDPHASFPELKQPHEKATLIVIPAPPDKGPDALKTARELFRQKGLTLKQVHIQPIRGNMDVGFDLISFGFGQEQIDPQDPHSAQAREPRLIIAYERDGPQGYAQHLGFAHPPAPGRARLEIDESGPLLVDSSASDYALSLPHSLHLTEGSRQISIVIYQTPGNVLHLAMEDDEHRSFHRSLLPPIGRVVLNTLVPVGTRNVMLRFYAPDGQTARLPSNILVYQVFPVPPT
jgi:hypothetical protein